MISFVRSILKHIILYMYCIINRFSTHKIKPFSKPQPRVYSLKNILKITQIAASTFLQTFELRLKKKKWQKNGGITADQAVVAIADDHWRNYMGSPAWTCDEPGWTYLEQSPVYTRAFSKHENSLINICLLILTIQLFYPTLHSFNCF